MKRIFLIISYTLLLLVFLTGASFSQDTVSLPIPAPIPEIQGAASIINDLMVSGLYKYSEENNQKVVFTFTGDILMHTSLVNSFGKNGSYDFSPMFTDISDELDSTDFLVTNIESTVNPKRQISGYPAFNCPVDIFATLKNHKVNALIQAHNHILDTGLDGVISTVSLTEKNGIKNIGAGTPGSIKYAIFEKHGVKAGILGYTYSTNVGNLYGDYINYIDRLKIKKDMDTLKNKEACNYLIVYLHIGTEYVRTVEPEQQDIVDYITGLGADAVICSHPHVAKKSEILNKNNKQVFIDYSMGNLISDQVYNYTDIGSIVKLGLLRSEKGVLLDSAETIPVYRLKYSSSGRMVFKAVPVKSIDKYSTVISKDKMSYIKKTAGEIQLSYNR
ncbi:MAG: CapA family protein [Bacillota bacterium]|nr:CapA family protein [Bacillota bacterium]